MLEKYYSYRASEYEQIYYRDDLIRQKEQTEIAASMKKVLAGRDVLEIACGTGFWTAFASDVVKSILATDISDKMLAIAEPKNLPEDKVKFCKADAYDLDGIEATFNAGLANFWLSHTPKSRIAEFLRGFHEKLKHDSVVFMADNVYVEGIGGQLVKKSDCPDTFKLRELADGSKYEVLKNYYEEAQLREILKPHALNLEIKVGSCFWWLTYNLS